jgi:hypothetical protein
MGSHLLSEREGFMVLRARVTNSDRGPRIVKERRRLRRALDERGSFNFNCPTSIN